MIGNTAKVISASRQLMFSMMTRMPSSTNTSSTIDTTPAVNISFSASTSLVTRVTRRPTGFLSKKEMCRPLQVTENLRPQIEHHLLPGPLHDVGLSELQQEAEQQQANVHSGDLGDAGERIAAEEAVEQRMRFVVAGEVLVDGDFGEVGA